MQQLWGSRFSKSQDEIAKAFNSSLEFDCKLYSQDIQGSLAHVKMLGCQKILTETEVEKITTALNEIKAEIETGKLVFNPDFEDIHTNIEKFLVEKIGEVGKKLHTARSRNDQVALDLRLFISEEIDKIQNKLLQLIETFIKIQKENTETIMPGYTHMQRAQIVTLAHYFGAYVEMFKRDFERLSDCKKRVTILPLGACALAGTPHNIDRTKTAEILHFPSVGLNSMDCVSDRDFVIESLSDLSMIMLHLSRFSEEMILWASFEFKFIEVDDRFSTGSSIMPQKKNPDMFELIRGKSGRVYGSLLSLLTTMKSLPLAYNKDMQEDKEPVFDAIRTVKDCLSVLIPMLETLKYNKENMLNAVNKGFLNATDVADYLANKGVPFREAHQISGNLVKFCEEHHLTLNELSLEQFKEFYADFDLDIFDKITPMSSLKSKNSLGGCAPDAVKAVISINEKWVSENKKS